MILFSARLDILSFFSTLFASATAHILLIRHRNGMDASTLRSLLG
ncbi:MAG: hypothetical protein OJF51_000479 [Nitrospira sp.]|nr:MAG: hypothetical protein OJF51_000479 [Nitrospira sp.]